MGRKRADNTIDTFNQRAMQEGVTYAQAQIRETQGKIERIRAPRPEDGADPIYMTVAARNALKNLGKTGICVSDNPGQVAINIGLFGISRPRQQG